MKDSHAELFHTYTQNTQAKFLKKEQSNFCFIRRGDTNIENPLFYTCAEILYCTTQLSAVRNVLGFKAEKKCDPSSMYSTPKNTHATQGLSLL